MGKQLGELEQLILLAILREGDDAYGVRIRESILERTGREVSAGGIYTILSRLERAEMVSSDLADATHARGGRRRKYYRLTPKGRTAVRAAVEAVAKMAEGVLRPVVEV